MNKVLVACFALTGAVMAATSAQAACSQQFSHTTCDWLGRNCKNHFKSVCTPDKISAPKATIAPSAKAGIATNAAAANNAVAIKPGAKLVGTDAGSIMSRDGAGILARDGAGMRPR